VPGTQLLLSQAPTEENPSAVEPGGKIQETVLQTSLGKPDPQRQDLLPDQTLDLAHSSPDGLPVSLEVVIVRVFRVLNLPTPDHIQDLDLVRTVPHQLPEFLDFPKNLPEVG